MKNRIFNFIAFITIPLIVCLGVVFYYKVSEFNSSVWQSKAIIAQVKPAIIQAESQADINRAVAFSVYTNSAITAFAVGIPYVIILVYVFYKLLVFGVQNYEKLRDRSFSTAKSN